MNVVLIVIGREWYRILLEGGWLYLVTSYLVSWTSPPMYGNHYTCVENLFVLAATAREGKFVGPHGRIQWIQCWCR